MVRAALAASYGAGRKVAVGIIGGTVLALGVLMIVLPGPAVLVIPLGLGILAAEFAWARRWLERLRERQRALDVLSARAPRFRARCRPQARLRSAPLDLEESLRGRAAGEVDRDPAWTGPATAAATRRRSAAARTGPSSTSSDPAGASTCSW